MPDPFEGLMVPRGDKSTMAGIAPGASNVGYGGMESTVRGLANLPGLTETILPSIRNLLMPGKNNPYEAMIDRSTQGSVAAAQTESMKRGLTGSDIEFSAMEGAKQTGEMAKSNFFAQNATQMASFFKDLVTGDIESQRGNLMALAELMGQELTSQRDIQMFREMLSANMDQASKNRKAQLWGAGMNAATSAAGSAATMMMLSDERLKVLPRLLGRVAGINIYAFRWSKVAQAFGAHNRVEVGVLAQDVEAKYPEASREIDGWKAVDYSKMPSEVFSTVRRLSACAAGA